MLSWKAEELITLYEQGNVGFDSINGYYIFKTFDSHDYKRFMLVHESAQHIPLAYGSSIENLRCDLIEKLDLYKQAAKDLSSDGSFITSLQNPDSY